MGDSRKRKGNGSVVRDQWDKDTSTILAGILRSIGEIPQTIQDNSEKSLLEVSAITDDHKAIVVSQSTEYSNNISRKRIRQETENELQLVSYRDRSDSATMLTTNDTGSELPSIEYNSENNKESKQNHDNQTGKGGQFE